MRDSPLVMQPAKKAAIYYGWIIVVVGFLAHIASAFSISSTLSVFLKPLSSDLGISRGVFSLIRSGEILIGAAAAPLVGAVMDRHGGRWLMAAGGLISGAGFILLGQARDFSQFMLVRWLLISPGDSLMGSMVVNVSISRWFVRLRGRTEMHPKRAVQVRKDLEDQFSQTLGQASHVAGRWTARGPGVRSSLEPLTGQRRLAVPGRSDQKPKSRIGLVERAYQARPFYDRPRV